MDVADSTERQKLDFISGLKPLSSGKRTAYVITRLYAYPSGESKILTRNELIFDFNHNPYVKYDLRDFCFLYDKENTDLIVAFCNEKVAQEYVFSKLSPDIRNQLEVREYLVSAREQFKNNLIHEIKNQVIRNLREVPRTYFLQDTDIIMKIAQAIFEYGIDTIRSVNVEINPSQTTFGNRIDFELSGTPSEMLSGPNFTAMPGDTVNLRYSIIADINGVTNYDFEYERQRKTISVPYA